MSISRVSHLTKLNKISGMKYWPIIVFINSQLLLTQKNIIETKGTPGYYFNKKQQQSVLNQINLDPVNIYLFKISNRNIRNRSEICSKLAP